MPARKRTKATTDSFDTFIETVELTKGRIGRTRRDRLAWVVRKVQEDPRTMTPPDVENLRLELAVFVSARGLRPYGETGSISGKSGQVDQPTEAEARTMLERMGEMVQHAVNREPVPVAQVRGGLTLRWMDFEGKQWWQRDWSDFRTLSWEEQAAHAVAELLEREGHFLKECPAPAIRAKQGETCGLWFVANRPRQEYCSATCQSRASTRAARAGTQTPAMLNKRRERKEE